MEPIQDFISKTGKSKVAVIVPLYGYWSTVKDNPLNLDTLRATFERIQSRHHNLVMFVVAEDLLTPLEIQNKLVVLHTAGNMQGVAVDAGASYAEYVRTGLRAARTETDAAYFIVLNPWVLIQTNGIDMMVDRINSSDSAKLISGYKVNSTLDPEDPEFADAFEAYNVSTPKEEREVSSDFMGISRYALEMCELEENIRTHRFFEYDLWQQMYRRQFEAISTQRLPMYVMPIDMDMYQPAESIELDRVYFTSKWGFTPEL